MSGRVLPPVDFHDQLPTEGVEEGDYIWVGEPLLLPSEPGYNRLNPNAGSMFVWADGKWIQLGTDGIRSWPSCFICGDTSGPTHDCIKVK